MPGQRTQSPKLTEGHAEFGEELLVHHAVVIRRRLQERAACHGREAFEGEVVGGQQRNLVVPRPGDELLGLFYS